MIFCKPYSDTWGDNDEDDDDVFEQVASFKGVAQSYKLHFAPGIRNLHARLETAVREAANRVLSIQRAGRSVKYYLSLSCNFYKIVLCKLDNALYLYMLCDFFIRYVCFYKKYDFQLH